MNQPVIDALEKVRQQFDQAPYPRIPLEQSPKDDATRLYTHSLVTAFYLRNQQIINTQGAVILDAGCGTGYKSLMLAEANPGATIVGVDLSSESVKLAEQRLKHYDFHNAEFHAISIEDLPSLKLQFDYINADEVLYLLPDPVAGLQAMRSVLKPNGIIRTNFHSALQRMIYFRAQAFFKSVGLMGGTTQDEDIELVRQTMRSLKNHVFLKSTVWNPNFETDDEIVLANYLLQGDKGWTIPEFFAAMRAADLEFISMVNWRKWDLLSLFTDIEELPISVTLEIGEKSAEEQLHLFELLHPVDRLLDLWCGHPHEGMPYTPVAEWTADSWQTAYAHLHPQLKTAALKEDLIACITQSSPFEISRHLKIVDEPVSIDSFMAGCLLPLLEQPQPVTALAQRWQMLRPFNPVTLEPTTLENAFERVQQLLTTLESLGYILLECPA
ncbi:methyltransferase domain-containing protein [Phormidium sp. FACHB-592]|uniref:Methyltransferase domain-containing protein n=1 Tax=Stenomitos frigidus AS-A4 TaxID=2933935 RepID=A0ABV0KGS2_9CYAN|nr:methyltransferase domain-containing protein [Phormidium sp. FACHB-592]MBD2073749.1 methyltransferase domain-containing protein [Phormidium sp. FACHB-592]